MRDTEDFRSRWERNKIAGGSCASGAYRPRGYHGYKTSPIFFVHVSCRHVLRMHAATLVDFRPDGGFNRDDTRKQRCKVYATRDTRSVMIFSG